ncbi:DUF1801 domain-containing protein [Acidipropionibacterium jensenii]|uniref:DUF1801 domain-containing protein n=1 Tax=Acidipropionibacterium jensenii TaxID=1749 RepID=A0A3Q9UK93_9ACTN|nr:DUF1801 domain-containing protein [Acidipropionibacterium jensenii]AZZ39927.1 DUF1801 domain-containing protein [Acidipropionibacterium jensenii]AZZ41666.1 DUF1801 domain-containing protein [Acidipropionibacterium jensenii]
MAQARRANVSDYYSKLPRVAQPHLGELRRLCQQELPRAEEVLHWNTPAFVQDGTRLVMLQSFKKHASLRFPTRYFSTVAEDVASAGFDAGAGFIKLPYDTGLPVDLLSRLIAGRRDEFESTGAAW